MQQYSEMSAAPGPPLPSCISKQFYTVKHKITKINHQNCQKMTYDLLPPPPNRVSGAATAVSITPDHIFFRFYELFASKTNSSQWFLL